MVLFCFLFFVSDQRALFGLDLSTLIKILFSLKTWSLSCYSAFMSPRTLCCTRQQSANELKVKQIINNNASLIRIQMFLVKSLNSLQPFQSTANGKKKINKIKLLLIDLCVMRSLIKRHSPTHPRQFK